MEPNETSAYHTMGVQPTEYFRVVRERKWIVVVTVIVVVGLILAYSVTRTPQYQATAEVVRQTAALDQTLFGTSVFQIEDAQRELETGASLIKLTAVAQLVKDDLKSKHNLTNLLGMITVTTSAQTDIIRISAESPNAAETAAVANSFARQFVNYRQQVDRSILSAADGKVVAELATLTPAELTSERGVTLTQKHEELGILESMQTGGFEVAQEATTPGSPVSPRPLRNTLFALVGGLILGILLAFAREYADRRARDEQALEREFGLPVLASVPRVGRRWGTQSGHRSKPAVGFADLQSQFLEAFRTLRSNLKFYQLDKKNQTLVITSGLPQEGKTVTTINLALSLALSGARVILLEADLRRPMLHQYLGLSKDVGMSSVLVGTSSFSESLQIVRVPDLVLDPGLNGKSTPDDAGLQTRLLCMTSGPLPPNPAELLGSPRMRELIATAAAHAEYVLIDTPPLLLVSDAIGLADCADGVIIAARMKNTTVDEARDVRRIVERSGLRALGIVANGVKGKRGGYYRGHYKGYYTASAK